MARGAPITAIPEADLDGNPATEAQADWQPFLITPNFPEYISGHSTFSAAAATILAATFGDATTFTMQSLGLPGVSRTFESFNAAAAEAGRSRIYGGIHYEFSNQDGQATGRKIGEWVLRSFSTTTDTVGPRILIEGSVTQLVTSQDPVLSGHVLDNLSGVAGLESRLDGGPAAAVTVDAQGRFTISPGLPQDGTADGSHVLQLVATDGAGNTSLPLFVTFTLDTRSPEIVLVSPDVGADLGMDLSLSGTVNGSGSLVTALAYQIDGGTSMPLAFDPDTGAIIGTLDLSLVAPGGHTVVVTAPRLGGEYCHPLASGRALGPHPVDGHGHARRWRPGCRRDLPSPGHVLATRQHQHAHEQQLLRDRPGGRDLPGDDRPRD